MRGEDAHLYHVPLTDDEAKKIKLGNEGQEIKFFSFDEIENNELSSNFSRLFTENKNLIRDLLGESQIKSPK